MGGKKTRLNNIYCHMKDRCHNPNSDMYKYYGARGIEVCLEWRNSYNTFKEWALSNGYSEDLTIDRIDNNKGYCPVNCRWITMKEQSRNKRSNRLITYKGETKTLTEWAEITGVNRRTLQNRLCRSHMDVELAFCKDKLYGNKVTYKGETKTVSQWANIIGISEVALYQRIFVRKIPLEKAFQKECKK